MGDVRGGIQAAGYGGGAQVFATENFAVGNMSIDEIMQVWADPEHMRPAVNPAYCHVGAGVASDCGWTLLLHPASSLYHCPCLRRVQNRDRTENPVSLAQPTRLSQWVVPVKIATPDPDGKIYHVVETGQSFWAIAIAYKITIRDIEVWNNLSRANSLRVGQKLFIPGTDTEGYATPTPVWMIIPAEPDVDGKIMHTVKAYQTLITIAQAYNVTVDRILALNGIQADWPLQIDQKLLIDPGHVTPSPTPRPLTPLEKLTPASDGKYYHTVQSGEYLAWIAGLYEVALNDIMAWNGLNANSIIRPGQQLLLQVTPPATQTHTPGPPTITPTVTRTPVPPTATPSPTATRLQPSPTLAASQPDGASGRLPIIALAAAAGLIVLLVIARKGIRIH
jgi:LysM repeat protein